MRRRLLALVALASMAVGLVVGRVVIAADAPSGHRPAPVADDATHHQGVRVNPYGRSESLVLVVGGVYQSRAQAEQAAAASSGELQGLYAARAGDFQLLALYADAAPARTALHCGGATFVAEAGALPELGQVPVDQLREDCKATPDRVLDVVRDVSLVHVRLPLLVGVDPAQFLECDRGAGCVSVARRVLGTSFTWPDSGWLTASAFRTKRGAEESMTYLREAIGLLTFAVQVRRVSGETEIGLGQEPDPGGSGPLLGPLADQERHQR